MYSNVFLILHFILQNSFWVCYNKKVSKFFFLNFFDYFKKISRIKKNKLWHLLNNFFFKAQNSFIRYK